MLSPLLRPLIRETFDLYGRLTPTFTKVNKHRRSYGPESEGYEIYEKDAPQISILGQQELSTSSPMGVSQMDLGSQITLKNLP